MDGSFTIQISSNLVKKLLDDGEKVKKKTRKPKPKIPQQSPSPKQPVEDSRPPSIELPKQPPFYQKPTSDVTRSAHAYEDSNNVLEERLERLKRQEENMLEEVTRRAKDLHDKEFKLPKGGPMPCVDQKNACFECYKEHRKDPLKCAQFVKDFAECARTVRQQVGANAN